MDRSHRPHATEVLNLGGTERILPPEKTLQHIQGLIQEAGITRLAHLTHLDTLGIPVYTAIRPYSKSLSTSQGKGLTDALAQCSAYMEAIEYYCAENPPLDMIATAKALPVAERCFEALPKGLIPANPHYSIEWTLCQDYQTQARIKVPRHFLSFDLTAAHRENGWFKKTTAGLASGNSFEEALVHGVYELIERNAILHFDTLSLVNKEACLIDQTTIPSGPARDLLDSFHHHPVTCLVFHMSSPFHIPAFYCLLLNTHPLRRVSQYEGYGCHINAEIALCRAITEAAQTRLTYIAGSRDDIFPEDYEPQIMDHSAKLQPKLSFLTIPSRMGLPLDHQLEHLHSVLKTNGFPQHLYLEYPLSTHTISVIHSIIPGLAL